ncbi:hypothetical protein E4U21_004858 [Claviceps maximensis]|nr:hypothetical protein E4U21_004858 [Claviceps maximensis]
MSSRFVSGGTIIPHGDNAAPHIPPDTPKDHDHNDASSVGPDSGGLGAGAGAAGTAGKAPPHMADTSTEWAAVQKELEDARRARAAQRSRAAEGERSLYEVLQANKAAKQAAFEEQNKIRNQFRALDDDEIEFLDEVKAAKRMEEERVRRETEEGLRAFREQQRRSSDVAGDEVTGAVGGQDPGRGTEVPIAGGGEWGGIGRKRKRGRERERVGLVRRKAGVGRQKEEVEEEEGDRKRAQEKNGEEEAKTAPAGDESMQKTALAGDCSRVKDRKSAAAPAIDQERTPTEGTGSKQKSLLVTYGSDDSDDE